MAEILEPDVNFIKQIRGLGGASLKVCYQCATCSTVCPLSTDDNPFPRREMIWAQWGLKDKLIKDPNIWLCHQCNDCCKYCPRGARPGDVMAALRAYCISEYAVPKFLAKWLQDKRYLPVLLAIPVIWFLFIIAVTTGFHIPKGEEIDLAEFVPVIWGVDLTFIPLSILVIISFAMSISRFWKDMKRVNLTPEQIAARGGWLNIIITPIKEILAHKRFSKCGVKKTRFYFHFLILWGFVGLAIVTALVFFRMDILGIHGHISMKNPIKWLANLAGLSLLFGSLILLSDRISDKETPSTYFDWSLVILVLSLAVTGFLTEFLRLGGLAGLACFFYFLHLVSVFYLIAYLPFSKLAHLVYRTVVMIYERYEGGI